MNIFGIKLACWLTIQKFFLNPVLFIVSIGPASEDALYGNESGDWGYGWFDKGGRGEDWYKITASTGKYSKISQQERGQWSADKTATDLTHSDDRTEAIGRYGTEDAVTEEYDELQNFFQGMMKDWSQPYPGQLSVDTPQGVTDAARLAQAGHRQILSCRI